MGELLSKLGAALAEELTRKAPQEVLDQRLQHRLEMEQLKHEHAMAQAQAKLEAPQRRKAALGKITGIAAKALVAAKTGNLPAATAAGEVTSAVIEGKYKVIK